MTLKDGPGEGTWSVFAEKLAAERDAAFLKGWNQALTAAEISVIEQPASLKTTNNIPTYYLDRTAVIAAIRKVLK